MVDFYLSFKLLRLRRGHMRIDIVDFLPSYGIQFHLWKVSLKPLFSSLSSCALNIWSAPQKTKFNRHWPRYTLPNFPLPSMRPISKSLREKRFAAKVLMMASLGPANIYLEASLLFCLWHPVIPKNNIRLSFCKSILGYLAVAKGDIVFLCRF